MYSEGTMGGETARVDPGTLRTYDGRELSPHSVYYIDNRDSGRPNSYEQLMRDMLRFLQQGWVPQGISREDLGRRLQAGLVDRAYQDTWLWEISCARLNWQAGLGAFGSNLRPIRMKYLPAANAQLLDTFSERLLAGDRPAGCIGSGGAWMFPDRLMQEAVSGEPGIAHKMGRLIDHLRRQLIPAFGICLSFQMMAEQAWGRGTDGKGDYLLEYLKAPNGREVEYHPRIRRYSCVPKGRECFNFGVRMVDRVNDDPLMSWINDTPALMVHGMGVRIPSDRVPTDAVLGISRRMFARRERQIGKTTSDLKLHDSSYDILQAAAFGPVMRGTQFHPELTPAFCLDLSYHPLIACMLTDVQKNEWPTEAQFTSKPLGCFINEERLARLAAMQDEIRNYPWKKFVIEPKAYNDDPRGKRYPAGAAAAYNFLKFFVFIQYIVTAYMDGRIDEAEAHIYLERLLTTNQKPMVLNVLKALGVDAGILGK